MSAKEKDLIFESVNQIESRSGIKRISSLVVALSVVLLASFGFTIGLVFLTNGYSQSAGVCFIFTPLFTYFITVGRVMIKGGQMQRLCRFVDEEKSQIKQKLRDEGYFMNLNFENREFLCFWENNKNHKI